MPPGLMQRPSWFTTSPLSALMQTSYSTAESGLRNLGRFWLKALRPFIWAARAVSISYGKPRGLRECKSTEVGVLTNTKYCPNPPKDHSSSPFLTRLRVPSNGLSKLMVPFRRNYLKGPPASLHNPIGILQEDVAYLLPALRDSTTSPHNGLYGRLP